MSTDSDIHSDSDDEYYTDEGEPVDKEVVRRYLEQVEESEVNFNGYCITFHLFLRFSANELMVYLVIALPGNLVLFSLIYFACPTSYTFFSNTCRSNLLEVRLHCLNFQRFKTTAAHELVFCQHTKLIHQSYESYPLFFVGI